jgi:hypothetical protein
MKTYKRPINAAQASACESALHPRCKCRCGGALHGISHRKYAIAEQEILNSQGYIEDTQVQDIINILEEDN